MQIVMFDFEELSSRMRSGLQKYMQRFRREYAALN